MFKKGDKVKINQGSMYFNLNNQLPYGLVGKVTEDQLNGSLWIYVKWDGGNNSYRKEDLIKVNTFKGNK